jgi:hypothetical protein
VGPPRGSSFARSVLSRRSIVAGAIRSNCAAVVSSICNSLNLHRRGTKSARAAASSRPHGVPMNGPAEPQRLDHRLPVERRPRRPEPDGCQHQRWPQRLPAMVPVPARRRAHLVQNLLLRCPVREDIVGGSRLGDSCAHSSKAQGETPIPQALSWPPDLPHAQRYWRHTQPGLTKMEGSVCAGRGAQLQGPDVGPGGRRP